MQRTERLNNPLAAFRAALDGWQTGIWTALPAILQSFDAAKITCVAQPAIKVTARQPDGSASPLTLPLCNDCPVIFPSGGGFVLTFPLTKGDEGTLLFASRCIDAWWQSGGVQPQAELRMHDLSDGFFLPGVFSQPRKPSAAVAANVAQLRSLDGQTLIEVGAGEVRMTPDNGTTVLKLVAGAIQISGSLTVTGTITAGQGGADQVGLQTHKHAANNTPPTPGT
jgi:hypothetical protein